MTELRNKLENHKIAYMNMGEPVPPYRVTLLEWQREWNYLKALCAQPQGAEMLDIRNYLGVDIEIVMKVLA